MKPEELNGNHKNIINNVLDQIMDEYAADNKIIFFNESDRAKHQFDFINKGVRDWKKSKQCMVPDCSKHSINKSHTIPKGMSLTQISECGNLLTPGSDQKLGIPVLKPVGVSLATTFPGFCPRHERLFLKFETQMKLETEEHIYLQTYRAACRELFRSRHVIEQLDKNIPSYCLLRDERLRKLVQQRMLNKGFPQNTVIESFSMSNDPLITQWDDKIAGLRRLSAHIQDRLIPALENAVFNGREEEIDVTAIHLDLQIPVALSGCAPVFFNAHGLQKEVLILINVVPCAGHSLLIIGCDINNKDYVHRYISNWTVNPFSIISMIETWMVNGTDQWYLKPSVWNALPDCRKTAILDSIIECKQHIGEEYGLSIFDDIRTTLLLRLQEEEELTQKSPYRKIIESQKAKMI